VKVIVYIAKFICVIKALCITFNFLLGNFASAKETVGLFERNI